MLPRNSYHIRQIGIGSAALKATKNDKVLRIFKRYAGKFYQAFLIIALLVSNQAAFSQTNVTATSLAQLISFSGLNNANVTMAPGEYWISGDRPDAYGNKSVDMARYDL